LHTAQATVEPAQMNCQAAGRYLQNLGMGE
jgi:hypothetical protein